MTNRIDLYTRDDERVTEADRQTHHLHPHGFWYRLTELESWARAMGTDVTHAAFPLGKFEVDSVDAIPAGYGCTAAEALDDLLSQVEAMHLRPKGSR